ncbi:hypothetical protein OQX61_06250 [Pedobacter sp. PLR]|uniref:hypothetical protein n=1 Tax=Pedobacter sp. PLR TaxID=2994465 RepID=UPI002247A3DA|nr:hypothetical protein [Pedobacter sp. PLR]MCX2450872.1 hypothetical protein [Pedobacter sp. PLR]
MMNQEDIFRKIGLILEELQDQYAYLARNQQQLNELELELFMANANFLSDHVQIVRKLNSAKILKEIPAPTTPDLVAEVSAAANELSWEKPSSAQQNLSYANSANVPSEVLETQAPVSQPDLSTSEEITIPEKKPTEERQVQEFSIEESPVLESVPEEKPTFQTPVIAETPAHPNELFTVPATEKESFRLDKEPSTFEFILNDSGSTDKFDFEEKTVDVIFDRPLTEEEEHIIAQKQKLREQEAQHQVEETKVGRETEDDDELGPEPFLVAKEALVAKEEDVVPPARTDLQPDPIAEKIIEERIPVENVATEHLASGKDFTAPIAESPAAESAKPLSLNERLASQLGTNLKNTNSDPQRSTLTDLKHGINLNDKMLYIKELFNGYNLAYAEVIDLLNKMSDFKTADSFLQNNYAEKNNWAGKSATVAKFYELLHQRFPAK